MRTALMMLPLLMCTYSPAMARKGDDTEQYLPQDEFGEDGHGDEGSEEWLAQRDAWQDALSLFACINPDFRAVFETGSTGVMRLVSGWVLCVSGHFQHGPWVEFNL